MDDKPSDIVTFWREAGPTKWFKKDEAFDTEIAERFMPLYDRACRGELDAWAEEPGSALALILVFDQFSRNLYRNDARAFAQDGRCVRIVHDAMANGDDRKIPDDLAPFIYMPLMHSENLSDQQTCIDEMERLGKADNVKFARIHYDIIEKFGRFPHRNTVLGRITTPEEEQFLADGGFSG